MSTSEGGAGGEQARARWVQELARLAAEVERDPEPETCPAELVQHLLALGVRLYAAKREVGESLPPFPEGCTLTATEVGTTVAPMLKAADVELFELAMWQHLIDPE